MQPILQQQPSPLAGFGQVLVARSTGIHKTIRNNNPTGLPASLKEGENIFLENKSSTGKLPNRMPRKAGGPRGPKLMTLWTNVKQP